MKIKIKCNLDDYRDAFPVKDSYGNDLYHTVPRIGDKIYVSEASDNRIRAKGLPLRLEVVAVCYREGIPEIELWGPSTVSVWNKP